MNAVFVPVLWLKKDSRCKEALENVADGVEAASALYGLGLKVAGKVFNYANKIGKAADVIHFYWCNVVSVI